MADPVPRISRQSLRSMANRARVLTIVLAAGLDGIAMKALHKTTGMSITSLQKHLGVLSGSGQVECSDATGQGCRWGPPGTWAHHQGNRDRNAARREARAARSHQVRRPRATARRLPPNSVWALADLCHG